MKRYRYTGGLAGIECGYTKLKRGETVEGDPRDADQLEQLAREHPEVEEV